MPILEGVLLTQMILRTLNLLLGQGGCTPTADYPPVDVDGFLPVLILTWPD